MNGVIVLIRGLHIHRQDAAGLNAVIPWLSLHRRVIVCIIDLDLHISYDISNLYPFPPLLHINGDIEPA